MAKAPQKAHGTQCQRDCVYRANRALYPSCPSLGHALAPSLHSQPFGVMAFVKRFLFSLDSSFCWDGGNLDKVRCGLNVYQVKVFLLHGCWADFVFESLTLILQKPSVYPVSYLLL